MLALCWHQARSLVLRFEGENTFLEDQKVFVFTDYFFFSEHRKIGGLFPRGYGPGWHTDV